MKKPVIGISLDLQNDNGDYSYSKFPWYALRKNYSDSVSAAGGFPIMLPFDESAIEQALDLIDGLIVPGGDWDIDPIFYGQNIISQKVIINHDRTSYDMKLMKKALDRDMPILGICYGMQLMNVILGGDMIQDLKELRPTDINHEQPEPKNIDWHEIQIVSGTKLSKIARGVNIAKVNSTHHQAIDRVGSDLIISAVATDGIIEAIESTRHEFAIGVEWHPEYGMSDLDRALFKELIDSCK
ncbi:MAG: hypothetical protein RLZZ59_586 [Pseudomonadota bacterium]|jgi:putative glutamine amidotransferase